MTEWMKVGTDIAVGGFAGAIDQVVQNIDDTREKTARGLASTDPGYLSPDKKAMPMLKQIGTYVDYGVPLLGIGMVAMGVVKGDMATRLLAAGGQMAGRKITHQVTAKVPAKRYTVWERVGQKTPALTERPHPQGAGSVLEF